MTQKLAVVLFNLGGPDGPDAVRPFLFNLFRDPAIIGAPAPIRYPLARLAGSRHRDAEAFRRFLLSPTGHAILARYGFSAP